MSERSERIINTARIAHAGAERQRGAGVSETAATLVVMTTPSAGEVRA